MPLEAINKASAREKSIRHGHPSTLHLWWARRPLAACRAVLFGQLVDDPSSWPEEFPTTEDQERERARLHRVIAEMVPWKATNDEVILNKARFEIARSIARDAATNHRRPTTQQDSRLPRGARTARLRPVLRRRVNSARGAAAGAPSVRVGPQPCRGAGLQGDLRDPAKFAGRPPVNPARSALGTWKGAQGLAEDIRYYGQWMRDEAEARIGHLYPKVKVTKAMAAEREDLKPHVGKELTVIAWLWARTVASPDPMMRGAHVPLGVHSCSQPKSGNQTWAEVVLDVDRQNGWRFVVKTGSAQQADEGKKKLGTRAAKAQDFTCCFRNTYPKAPTFRPKGKNAWADATDGVVVVRAGATGSTSPPRRWRNR